LPTHKSTKNPNLVTINKVPPLPPLLAKTKKEVIVISKYFLSNKPMVENKVQGNINNSGKSYAQATKTSNNMSEVLKIKEMFPSLNAQKVDQVNNIVKLPPGGRTTSPQIQILLEDHWHSILPSCELSR